MKPFLSAILLMMTLHSYAGDRVLDWQVRNPKSGEWIPLGQKGSVQEVFIREGLMPDPFVGLNEDKFRWFEELDWEFAAEFELDSNDLSFQFAELDFASIDTYGTVYLNDSVIGSSANAFIPHRFQVKKWLKPGVNRIRVVITPPVKKLGAMYKNADYHLPAPNDVHDTAVAPYVRKPQYQFGWDWSLRMNTIGFNDLAQLHFYNDNRIYNHSVKTVRVLSDRAEIEMDLFLVNEEEGQEYIWESSLFGRDTVRLSEGKLTRSFQLDEVRLWWPRGFGEAYLYADSISVKCIDGKEVGVIDLKFGVKTSELVQNKDQWGESYYFRINNVPVFCKGADYIPQDVFPARITDEDVRKMVGMMAESNFNMVRVWGGGFYQKDAFYEECDRLGIMVWQDLMFACAMYPGDEEFLSNVRQELNYQVPRIGGHASTMQFNGNNEVEVAWNNWGFQIKYGLYGKSAREIEQAYSDLFKVLAPGIVGKYTTIPYIHTSPLSNWGKSEYYNSGSQHYWGVWHGKDPIEDFGKKIGRFNAEYGFQSFPEFNTLLTFSDTTDWKISSAVMNQHQKSYVGNEMIMKQAKRLYGTPSDFREFVYFSQLTQAMAVSMAIAGHRIDAPRCGGTLYWQLNDCWPVSSWSSIDYYWNWKALQYRVEDDYRDVSVLCKYNDLNDRDYYLVSGLRDSVSVTARYTIYDLKGKKIDHGEQRLTLGNMDHYQFSLPKEKKRKCWFFRRKKAKSRLIEFSWKMEGGLEYSRNFLELGEHKKTNIDKVKLRILAIDEKNREAVLELTNKEFVADLWITSKKLGVRFSENFCNYLPGTHQIRIHFEETPTSNDFELFYR